MRLKEEIENLKKRKNIAILAHNYQLDEIQRVADIVGDSLELSLKSMKLDVDTIIFAGVKFMAEQVKVLNMEKRILMPDPGAICSLAHMISKEIVVEYKKKFPEAPLVIYVNAPTEIKALADYVVTSANAADLVARLDEDIILFGPDANLADHVAQKTGKKVIPVPPMGHCYVHLLITIYDVKKAKQKYPDAPIIVHPEVPREVRKFADYIGSTGQMIKIVRNINAKRILIGTETGMIYRLKREFPNKEFIPIVENAVCIGMKKNTLEKILYSLQNEVYEVDVKPSVANNVRKAILRTFEVLGLSLIHI